MPGGVRAWGQLTSARLLQRQGAHSHTTGWRITLSCPDPRAGGGTGRYHPDANTDLCLLCWDGVRWQETG